MNRHPKKRSVVNPTDLHPVWELMVRAAVLGMFSSVASLVSMALLGTLLPDLAVAGMVILGSLLLVVAPVMTLQRQRQHVSNQGRALAAGAGFGIGLTFPIQLLVVVLAQDDGLSDALIAEALCLVFTLLMAAFTLLLWELSRRKGTCVMIQDGTLCPGCAYSLTGSTSLNCPECGYQTTLEELGTTQERLLTGQHGLQPGITPRQPPSVAKRIATQLFIVVFAAIGSVFLSVKISEWLGVQWVFWIILTILALWLVVLPSYLFIVSIRAESNNSH